MTPMRVGWLFLVVVSVLASTGCGDDSDDESPAVTKCHDFAQSWCSETIGCFVTLGKLAESERARNVDVCYDTAVAAAQCKRAVQIGATYNQCLSDISTMDCARWDVPEDQLSTVTAPATCNGVILIAN